MDDRDFTIDVKRYLRRRGETYGGTVFRRPSNGWAAPSPMRADKARLGADRVKESPPVSVPVPDVVRPAVEAAGKAHDSVRPAVESAGAEPKRRGDGEQAEKVEARASDGLEPREPTPPRREYVVKEPMRRTREAAQTDLFGEAPAAPEPTGLEGLDIEALEERVSTCMLCPLCEERNRTVFGSGDSKAKLVFVGEAPGREEDKQGEPFVGRAGQLLTKIIASVGFTREEVYITNILKCRPPDNRDPNEKEVRACKPYLERQIELLEPVLICALGRVAGQNLLERNASLSVMRKHIHYYHDVRTIVTYHPAALLRNPNLKRAAWEDIQETRRIYDEALEESE